MQGPLSGGGAARQSHPCHRPPTRFPFRSEIPAPAGDLSAAILTFGQDIAGIFPRADGWCSQLRAWWAPRVRSIDHARKVQDMATYTVAAALASSASGISVADTAANIANAVSNASLDARVTLFSMSANGVVTAPQAAALAAIGHKFSTATYKLTVRDSVAELTAPADAAGLTITGIVVAVQDTANDILAAIANPIIRGASSISLTANATLTLESIADAGELLQLQRCRPDPYAIGQRSQSARFYPGRSQTLVDRIPARHQFHRHRTACDRAGGTVAFRHRQRRQPDDFRLDQRSHRIGCRPLQRVRDGRDVGHRVRHADEPAAQRAPPSSGSNIPTSGRRSRTAAQSWSPALSRSLPCRTSVSPGARP